jgi:hypothetical protein
MSRARNDLGRQRLQSREARCRRCQTTRLAPRDRQAQGRHEGLRRPASPMGSRADLLMVRNAIVASPRISRTSPRRSPPSLPSPRSNSPQAPRTIVGFRVRVLDGFLRWVPGRRCFPELHSSRQTTCAARRRGKVVSRRAGSLSCRGARLSQLSDRRNRPGVSPITPRKFSVRRFWLENPAARPISAIERSVSRRSSSARRTRLPVRNRGLLFPLFHQ